MASKGKKATPADAQIVMQLFDLRRESEMRKARKFFAEVQFNPGGGMPEVLTNFGTQENAWMRQVLSYWEYASSLVLRGCVNRDLFMDWGGEIIFVYLKMKPFIKGIRDMAGPEFMQYTEKLLSSTPELRKTVAAREVRMKKWMEMQKAAAAAKR